MSEVMTQLASAFHGRCTTNPTVGLIRVFDPVTTRQRGIIVFDKTNLRVVADGKKSSLASTDPDVISKISKAFDPTRN